MRKEALDKLYQGTVIPAVPLVLDSNRNLNEAGQRRLVRYYLRAGAGGLAVAVHTTQFEIREPETRYFEKVLNIAAQEARRFEKETGKVIILVAGACGPVSQAIEEATIAKELGYDAVLLSPGGLSHLSEQEMVERTRAVAAKMPVIGFYLQPSVGGRVFSYQYWQSTCEIDNVVAIKTAPFNRYLTLDVVRAVALSSRADKIALYTGNDDNIVIDLLTKFVFEKDGKVYTKRFAGGLLGHWAVWTGTVVRMFDAIKKAAEQDYIPAELLTLAARVTDANSAFFDTANGFKGCITGIHEVLRRQGLMEGIWTLNEDEGLSPGQAEEIDRVYEMYPELNDDEFVKEFLEAEKGNGDY